VAQTISYGLYYKDFIIKTLYVNLYGLVCNFHS
jgi:hypothetical protein